MTLTLLLVVIPAPVPSRPQRACVRVAHDAVAVRLWTPAGTAHISESAWALAPAGAPCPAGFVPDVPHTAPENAQLAALLRRQAAAGQGGKLQGHPRVLQQQQQREETDDVPESYAVLPLVTPEFALPP